MSVIYRPDRQKYQADVKVNGKRKRPLFLTKREALEFEKFHRQGPSNVCSESITISEAFKAYFDDLSVHKNANTSKNEKRYFNLAFHFLSARGRTNLDQIECRDLQALQQWFLKEQRLGDETKEAWKASTVNRAFRTLNHFFVTMVDWEKITVNPAQSLKGFPEAEPEIEVIEPEVYSATLPTAPDWFKPTLEFIHEVGCRPSSVSRLKWADVDFKARTFTIKSRKGGVERLLTFEMSTSVFAILIKLRNQFPHLSSSEQVFRAAKGGPLSNAWISRRGCRLFKKVKPITGGAMKALRHTLASDLTTAGVPTEVVRQALGHSNIRTTQRYAKGIKPAVVGKAIGLVRGISVAPNGTKDTGDNSLGRAKGS